MKHDLAWLASFPGSDFRLWTRDYDLTFEGNIYQASKGASFSNAVLEIGASSRRATLSFRATDDATKALFVDDVGPDQVEVIEIYTPDRGLTWARTGVDYVGLISTPDFNNGIYSIELDCFEVGNASGEAFKFNTVDAVIEVWC